jgi:hypothetical protein
MSFELVIDRFETFVRGVYSPSNAGPQTPFPFQLESVRAVFEHHLAPLIVVARSDHELLRAERDEIVSHCRALLRHKKDKLLSASEITALEDYVDHFAPSPAQIDAALRALKSEGKDAFASLLAAADRVILADEVVRDEERSLLAEIKKQIDELSKS